MQQYREEAYLPVQKLITVYFLLISKTEVLENLTHIVGSAP